MTQPILASYANYFAYMQLRNAKCRGEEETHLNHIISIIKDEVLASFTTVKKRARTFSQMDPQDDLCNVSPHKKYKVNQLKSLTLNQCFSYVKITQNFEDNIAQLQKIGQQTEKGEILIELQADKSLISEKIQEPLPLYLVMEKQCYISYLMPETSLERLFPGSKTQHYYRFEFFDELEEQSESFIEILSNATGSFAELRYIRKGIHFSGNQAMKLVDQFVKNIGIQTLLLHDDASVTVPLSNQKEPVKLKLRALNILTGEGQTWYQKKGYQLVECLKLRVGDVPYQPGTKWFSLLTQSSKNYQEALESLRSLKLSDLIQALKLQHSKQATILEGLTTKYLKKSEKISDVNLAQFTEKLYQLYLKACQHSNPTKQQKQYTQDFVSFYKLIFENLPNAPKESLITQVDKWIDIIWKSWLWIKRIS